MSGSTLRMKNFLTHNRLNTICESARCPNQKECYGKGVATFMILGENCTRGCRYCSVEKGRPQMVDKDEPRRIAQAIQLHKLRHVVVTSVTRDDLKDGGAFHFVDVINYLKENVPEVTVEVLIPDFQGNWNALNKVIDASPHVLNHNMETVKDLYARVRPKADYIQSLEIIHRTKMRNSSVITKSGVMLGLGETKEELLELMQDLVDRSCDMLTLGQYFQPTKKYMDVVRYLEDDEFDEYKRIGHEIGFASIASGRFVRSSYLADNAFSEIIIRNEM